MSAIALATKSMIFIGSYRFSATVHYHNRPSAFADIGHLAYLPLSYADITTLLTKNRVASLKTLAVLFYARDKLKIAGGSELNWTR